MTHSLPNERTFSKQTGRHIRIYSCTTGKLSLDAGLICVCIWHKINTSTWNRRSVYICGCLPFGFFQVVACSLKSKYMLNLLPALRNLIHVIALYRCKFRRNSWCWFGIENRALVLKLSHNGKACRVQCKERTSVVFGQVRVRANETWSIKWEHVPMYTHKNWQLVSFCITFLDMCRYISWRWFFLSFRWLLLWFFVFFCSSMHHFELIWWFDMNLRRRYIDMDTILWSRIYHDRIDWWKKNVVKPCFISEKHQWISTYQIFDSICEYGLYRMRKYTIWFLLLFTRFNCDQMQRKYGLYKWEPEHIHTQIHTRTHPTNVNRFIS